MKILTNKYSYLIEFYLTTMDESEELKKIDNHLYITLVGLETIMHVFKITINQTKNIDLSIQYTQNTCFFYLEYIEQMNQTNSLHNLNNIDAVTFVFKKINDDINTTNNSSSTTSMTNQPSVSLKNENKIIHSFNKYSSTITKSILYYFQELEIEDETASYEYEFAQRVPLNIERPTISKLTEICKSFLISFISLIDYATDENDVDIVYIFKYIHLVQQHIQLSHKQYLVYLHEMYKHIYKMKKNNTLPSEIDLYHRFFEIKSNVEHNHKMETYKQNNKIANLVKLFMLG